jgi:hypothetical protein
MMARWKPSELQERWPCTEVDKDRIEDAWHGEQQDDEQENQYHEHTENLFGT